MTDPGDKRMNRNNRTNTLLVELMIVILFFALSVSVLVKMFSAAYTLSDVADVETRSLSVAQNIADEMKAATDAGAYLAENGFSQEGNRYSAEIEEYTIAVTLNEPRPSAPGILTEAALTVIYDDKELFTLDCTKYAEVTP